MKAVQYFTDDYIEQCQKTTVEQRLEFLENYRRLHQKNSPSKLISMKVPENLLDYFKARCEFEGVKYQTQIKKLMQDWLNINS